MKAIAQDRYGDAGVLALQDIDRTYPLADAAQAVRNIADGHATGKGIVVV